ncbi:MAG TPA: AtpZ/AtpI family protein [Chloroflexi bacterium]|nr:AtpZ/AtpI family protein [Chloroflexota bacterium]
MKDKQALSDLSKALQAASLGWDLALPIVGGILLGHALDNWLNTSYIFTVGLLFLGVFGGYYNLSRSVKRIERQKSNDEWIGH